MQIFSYIMSSISSLFFSVGINKNKFFGHSGKVSLIELKMNKHFSRKFHFYFL